MESREMADMELCGHAFRWLEEIRPIRDGTGAVVINRPDMALYVGCETWPKYGDGPFCTFSLAYGGSDIRLYCITSDSVLNYVGETDNLARRFGSQGYARISPYNTLKNQTRVVNGQKKLIKGQRTNCMINHLILGEAQKGAELGLWVCPTPDATAPRRRAIESMIKMSYRPTWNFA
jgi:hypothetical protein